jgi:GT2 family glycosyltransferase
MWISNLPISDYWQSILMRKYFYSLMRKYLSLFIRPENTLVDFNPGAFSFAESFGNAFFHVEDGIFSALPNVDSGRILDMDQLKEMKPDFIIIAGNVHYERDIQKMLARLHSCSDAKTRLILTYYSNLWRPFTVLASWLGFREKSSETNWLTHSDIENLLALENFELIRRDSRILIPVYIPVLSNLINKFVAPLPFFNMFSFVTIALARPVKPSGETPSVSIVVPARNEAGNIRAIVERIPAMGPDDEIIIVEGNSTDDTWDAVQKIHAELGSTRNLVILQQEGKGKGDAVRKGFAAARNDVLMILDADMTVPPEDLPKFYDALVSGKGEFINGSRLVYPMEKQAMRFLNMVGNKFFAVGFSFVLGQKFKDTLCGTKVISRQNYLRLAQSRSYFGEFDPFGDFDLIFGAARMGLKIIDVPVNYRERVYGETNISRWRHGLILLFMLLFAARRIKFL